MHLLPRLSLATLLLVTLPQTGFAGPQAPSSALRPGPRGALRPGLKGSVRRILAGVAAGATMIGIVGATAIAVHPLANMRADSVAIHQRAIADLQSAIAADAKANDPTHAKLNEARTQAEAVHAGTTLRSTTSLAGFISTPGAQSRALEGTIAKAAEISFRDSNVVPPPVVIAPELPGQ